MNKISDNSALIATVLFFCGILLFTFGLAEQEVIGFESRFYLFAKEMWTNGITLFPTTYNKAYPDYTSASTLCIYFFASLFGNLNKFTAVLPSAIAAAMTLSVTYLIAILHKPHNKRFAFAAVCMLLLTFTFFKSARLITLDVYPTLMTAICFYLVYSADVLNKSNRVWWTFIFLWLGFIFRGPIGLVIPTGVIVAYFAISGRWAKALTIGLLALVLLAISTILLLVLARQTGGDEFMHSVLRMQISGRLENHYRPFYFYFLNSLTTYAFSYPLALFVLVGAILYYKQLAKTEIDFLLKLFAWMFIILIGMSIAGDKKTRYVLPMAPAIALIAAFLCNQFIIKYFLKLQRLLICLFLFSPIIFVLIIEAIYFYDIQHSIELKIHYLWLITALVILQAINFAIMYYWWQEQVHQFFLLLVTLTISFCFIYLAAVEPCMLYLERGRYLIQAIEKQRSTAGAILVFYKEAQDGLPIKYLIDMPQTTMPVFVNDEQSLLAIQKPAFFVTHEKHFLQLPFDVKQNMRILANDSLGHVRVVIFTNK